MTRNLSIALGSCAIIGLSFLSIKQVGSIVKKNELLVKQDKYISELKVVSKGDDSVIIDLRSENQILKEQIHILKDSIDHLNNIITKLQLSNKQQTRAIADVKAQLQLHQARYDQLDLEMNEVKKTSPTASPEDARKLMALENERAELLSYVKELETQKLSYEVLKAENEMKLLYQQSAEANYQRISNIMNNTQVQFDGINIQQKSNSKSLKKIRKKWNYTKVNFDFITDDLRLIMNQQFLVRIVDTDTQEILKTIAEGEGGGKASEDIEMDGTIIRYTGEEINLSYYNHQPKTGQNYEVQIFYLDNSGKEYLLRHGTKQFVKSGKTVKNPA